VKVAFRVDSSEEIDLVFALISKCEDGLDVHTLLKGPVAHSGFKRLN
jgi:glutamate-1-semialdehyde 2,1-aminomutase